MNQNSRHELLFWPGRRILSLMVLHLLCVTGFSQVINNAISERIFVGVNQPPLSSTTARSTVESDCINKKLTAACLIYHNGQWFSFAVPMDGTYYLNVGDQLCKRKLGIQVLLIEGDPCAVDSYKVMRCIPKLTGEDTYVVLDSLKSDVSYLLNIDGFLGDYCEFSIQVADHAAGMPQQERHYEDSRADIELSDSIIAITSQLSTEDVRKISSIRIYRRYLDGAFFLLDSIMPGRNNALGEFITDYSFYDTLHWIGAYTYKVYGVRHDSRELLMLGQRQILYFGEGNRGEVYSVELPRALDRGKPITVRLINPPSGKVLETYTRYMQSKRAKVQVNFAKYLEAGYRDFVLELSNEASDKTELLFYRVTTDGRIVRR